MTFERDPGSKVIEVYDVRKPDGEVVREEVVTDLQPKALYDISVYELHAQSTFIDRTQKNSKPVVDYAPKSVGFFEVPAKLSGGKSDVYRAAKGRNNPAQVRRIDPNKWEGGDEDGQGDPFGRSGFRARGR